MKKKLLIYLSLGWAFIAPALQAQTWESFYGNGMAKITCAASDSTGNFWFGTTDDGLLSRSGSSFTSYNYFKNKLVSNRISSIAVAPDGSLWVGTDSGLMHSITGGWETFTRANSSFTTNEITRVDVASNGDVWVVQYPGVHRYKSGSWTAFNETNSAGYYNDYPLTCGIDKNNNPWFGGFGKEIWTYDGTAWSTRTDFGLDTVDYVQIQAIKFNAAGNMYIGTQNHGFYEVKGGVSKQYLGFDMGFYMNQINDIMVLGGKVYVAGEGGGLAIYDGSSFSTVGPNEGLQSDAVFTLTGYQGEVCASHKNHGLSIGKNNTWTKFNPSDAGVLETAGTYSVKKDAAGNVWVAGYGAIYKYDGKNWTTYNSNGTGIMDDYMLDIEFDSKNNVWVAFGSGLIKFTAPSTWENFDMFTSNFPDAYIYDIAIDKNDVIWMATDSGLVKFDGMTSTTYDKASGKVPTDGIFGVHCDNNSNVWAVTWGGGLVKYDGSSFSTIKASLNTFDNDYLTVVRSNKAGDIYLGYYGGYAVLKNGTWTNNSSNSMNMKFDYLYDVQFDTNSEPWFCSDLGVAYMKDGVEVNYSSPTNPLGDNAVFGMVHVGFDAWFVTGPVMSVLRDAVVLKSNGVKLPAFGSVWNVYPNPAKQQLYISAHQGAMASVGMQKFQLMDMQGKVIKEFSVLGNEMQNGKSMELNISGVAAGVYQLKDVQLGVSESVVIVK